MHVTKKHRKRRIDSKHGQMLNRANRKHCSCNGVLFQVCEYFVKFTRYKLIIASQGRGECKVDHFLEAKHNGKRWCYVDKGSCKDEKKGRSSGMFWSFEACRKGQTVRIRRKTYQWLSIEHDIAHLELRWFVGCCLWRAGCSYDRASTYWYSLVDHARIQQTDFSY